MTTPRPIIRVTFPSGYKYTALARDDLDRARLAVCIAHEQRRIARRLETKRRESGETVQVRARNGRAVKPNSRMPGPYVRWTFTPCPATGGGAWSGEWIDGPV